MGAEPSVAARRVAGASRRCPRARGPFARPARGAALTELVVSTLVLVPLFVGIPMLGKLVDVRQSAVQASRYAVWEATVDTGGVPPTNVAERFFGDPANPIVTAPIDAGENPLWGPRARERAVADARFGAAPVTVDPARVAVLAHEEGFGEGVARRAGEAVRAAGEALEGPTGGEWNLTADGLVRGGVRVEVDGNDWSSGASTRCASGAYGCVEERSVILVDGWNAGSVAMAERRVRPLVPMAALEDLGSFLANVGALPLFEELRGLDGALGHVDLEALPASERDRLRALRPYEEPDP